MDFPIFSTIHDGYADISKGQLPSPRLEVEVACGKPYNSLNAVPLRLALLVVIKTLGLYGLFVAVRHKQFRVVRLLGAGSEHGKLRAGVRRHNRETARSTRRG